MSCQVSTVDKSCGSLHNWSYKRCGALIVTRHSNARQFKHRLTRITCSKWQQYLPQQGVAHVFSLHLYYCAVVFASALTDLFWFPSLRISDAQFLGWGVHLCVPCGWLLRWVILHRSLVILLGVLQLCLNLLEVPHHCLHLCCGFGCDSQQGTCIVELLCYSCPTISSRPKCGDLAMVPEACCIRWLWALCCGWFDSWMCSKYSVQLL